MPPAAATIPIRRHRPKAVVAMTTCHNPLGSVMSETAKADLVALAAKYDTAIVEDVGPGEIAASDQWRSHCPKVVRRDELESSKRRDLPWRIRLVFGRDRIGAVESLERRRADHGRRLHVGNAGNLFQDLVVDPRHALLIGFD